MQDPPKVLKDSIGLQKKKRFFIPAIMDKSILLIIGRKHFATSN